MKRFIGILMVVMATWGLANSADAQSPCATGQAFKIVVIGSSTAAGSGPSPIDSAWVWRFRTYMQSLNPANQVINIARGGYTTYHMMPNGFVPPASRPDPDTVRNITYALAQNPDAIIINFPSNDVSRGYSVAEQLYNDSIVMAIAEAAGVPTWISTTQPKNFSIGSVSIQHQMEVRDSILARYGSRALNFWQTIADSNGRITPIYDSGDGTHLSNQGHWILFSRVKNANIPDSIYTQAPFPDHMVGTLNAQSNSLCGDPATSISVPVTNLGVDNLAGVPVYLRIIEPVSGLDTTLLQIIPGGQSSCTSDTLSFTFDTSPGGDYEFIAWTSVSGDSISANDSSWVMKSYAGYPVLVTQGDTGCGGASPLMLSATTGENDRFAWFDSPTSTTPIGSGSTFTTPLLTTRDTFYVEAYRGENFFRNDLRSTDNSNISWNGAMIDLVAHTAIVVDSFRIKINSTGNQLIKGYHKTGSYQGSEGTPGAWTYMGEDTLNVAISQTFQTVVFDSVQIPAGDTAGFYFHMTNSGSTLRYGNGTAVTTTSNAELSIVPGSGIAYTFGTTYFPRYLNCEVFYHYGNKPMGDCQTPRVPVPAVISAPSVSLGQDTILSTNASITLNPGSNYASYVWSDGSTNPTLILDGTVLGTSINTVIVTVTDSAGCTASDTTIIVFAPLLGQDLPTEIAVKIWPNPTQGELNWQAPHLRVPAKLSIIDLNGRSMKQLILSGQSGKLDVSEFPAGIYLGNITDEKGGQSHFKIIVQ